MILSTKPKVILTLLSLFLSGCQTLTPLPNNARVETQKTPQGLEASVLKFSGLKSNEQLPAVVVLHGQGETGNDVLGLWEKEAARRKIMIIAPDWNQWSRGGKRSKGGANIEDLRAGLDELISKNPIDEKRLAIAGVSAGALAARWLIPVQSSRWKAAIFSAFGSLEPWWKNIPAEEFPAVLFLHGTQDEQFSAELIEQNVQALKRKGVIVEWKEDPEAGHEHRLEWTPFALDWIEKSFLD